MKFCIRKILTKSSDYRNTTIFPDPMSERRKWLLRNDNVMHLLLIRFLRIESFVMIHALKVAGADKFFFLSSFKLGAVEN